MKIMKLFEGKIIGTPEMFKKLLQYYGADTSISCLISANICPRDMYKMRDSGRMYKLVPLKGKEEIPDDDGEDPELDPEYDLEYYDSVDESLYNPYTGADDLSEYYDEGGLW